MQTNADPFQHTWSLRPRKGPVPGSSGNRSSGLPTDGAQTLEPGRRTYSAWDRVLGSTPGRAHLSARGRIIRLPSAESCNQLAWGYSEAAWRGSHKRIGDTRGLRKPCEYQLLSHKCIGDTRLSCPTTTWALSSSGPGSTHVKYLRCRSARLDVEPELHRVSNEGTINCSQLPSPAAQIDVAIWPLAVRRTQWPNHDRRSRFINDTLTGTSDPGLTSNDPSPSA